MINLAHKITTNEKHLHDSMTGLVVVQHAIDENPLVVAPETYLRDVISYMSQGSESCRIGSQPDEARALQGVNYVLVIGQEKLLGIFTERDQVRLLALGIDLADIQIADAMTRQLITLPESELQDAFTTLTLFRQHHIRHLPILDDQANVVGVLTSEGLRQSLQASTLLKMQTVGEVMSTQPITASPTTSVMAVIQMMATHQISCVVIVQSEAQDAKSWQRPIGIITERDILRYQTLELDVTSLVAQAVMSHPLVCLQLEDTLWHAQQTMQQLHVRRLVVTDTQGALRGILTQTSMLSVLNDTNLFSTLEILQDQVDQLQNEKIRLLQALNTNLEHQIEEDAVVLKTYQSYCEATFEQAAVGIVHSNLQGQFLFVNRCFCRLLGYSQSELLTKTFLDVTYGDDQHLGQSQLQQLIRHEIPAFTQEKRYICQDGSILWGKVTVTLATSASDIPNYLIAMIEDVSDRKQAEFALQQVNQELEEQVIRSSAASQTSEQRYRALFESAPDLLFVLNEQGLIQQVNTAVLERLGYSEAELLDRPLTQFWVTAPPLTDSQILQILLEQGHWRHTIQCQCRDGSSLFVDCVYSIITDQLDLSPHILVIQRDISAQIEAEAALKASEARFLGAFQYAAIGMALVSPDGRWLKVNASLCDIVGYSESEMLTLTCQDLTHPQDLEEDSGYVEQMLLGERDTFQMEKRYIHKQGHAVWVLASASLALGEENQPLYFITQVQDINQRKLAEAALQENNQNLEELVHERTAQLGSTYHKLKTSEANYQDLYNNAPDMYVSVDAHTNQIFQCNQTLCDTLGFRKEEILDRSIFDIYHPDCHAQVETALQIFVEWGEVRDAQLQLRCRNGRKLEVSLNSRAIKDETGKILYICSSWRDITERVRANQKVFHHAYYDSLTDLPNRALFVDRLQHLIDLNQWYGNQNFAVLFIDLDRFKIVNDSLGHPVGDQLLIATAQRLQDCLRPTDTVARFGGDEFAILVEQIEDINCACMLAERINHRLGTPFHLGNYDLFNSASIGIVQGHSRYDLADELIRDADIAMYQAKTNGKGCYAVFDAAMHTQVKGQLTLEHDLRRAIVDQQLTLHFQPIVSLINQEIVGFEALTRWQHPQRGLIPPGMFIPTAEETGLIVPLDLWAIRQACQQLRIWQDLLPSTKVLEVSVNLSCHHFSRADVVEQIVQILADTGLDATSLKLEITESALIENPDSAAQILSELRALGLRIDIDDFGTGYSSLSYLHKYDIDTLKVDRSFIQYLDCNPDRLEIVRTIVVLAHTLQMDAIAEGIETAEQLAIVKSLGCEFGQGYYFYRPLTCKQVDTLIRNQTFFMASKPALNISGLQKQLEQEMVVDVAKG